MTTITIQNAENGKLDNNERDCTEGWMDEGYNVFTLTITDNTINYLKALMGIDKEWL